MGVWWWDPELRTSWPQVQEEETGGGARCSWPPRASQGQGQQVPASARAGHTWTPQVSGEQAPWEVSAWYRDESIPGRLLGARMALGDSGSDRSRAGQRGWGKSGAGAWPETAWCWWSLQRALGGWETAGRPGSAAKPDLLWGLLGSCTGLEAMPAAPRQALHSLCELSAWLGQGWQRSSSPATHCSVAALLGCHFHGARRPCCHCCSPLWPDIRAVISRWRAVTKGVTDPSNPCNK